MTLFNTNTIKIMNEKNSFGDKKITGFLDTGDGKKVICSVAIIKPGEEVSLTTIWGGEKFLVEDI